MGKRLLVGVRVEVRLEGFVVGKLEEFKETRPIGGFDVR